MILALLLVSLFCALGYGLSVLVVALLRIFEGRLTQWSSTWRTRAFRWALLAPVTGASLILAVVLAPSFLELAGVAGHCDLDPGHHAHLCFLHFSAQAPFPIVALGALLTLVTLVRAARSLHAWARERHALLSLVRTGNPRAGAPGIVEFDSEVPVCVTLGLRTPQIFLSTAVIAALGASGREAALEHERAHVHRGDDRALLFGQFAALLHVPFFGPRLLARWQQETELTCDALAAKATGNPVDLAGAIVRFHRALMDFRRASPSAGACFCQTSSVLLDRRVRALLDEAAIEAPVSDDGRVSFAAVVVLLALGGLLQATDLHHAIESALGWLGVVH